MYKWRINYCWNSKFADWLRRVGGVPSQPKAATLEEWKEYRTAARMKNRFVYWLSDDGLDTLQDIIMFPSDVLNESITYISNRFIDKTHLINTGLEKGRFHETEDKILHGVMQEVVDFVEIQCASMQLWTDKNKNYKRTNWLPKFVSRLIPFRSQQLGVDHLLWEITLRKDDSWFGYNYWTDSEEELKRREEEKKNNSEYMKPTPQAATAMRLLDVYVWWKFIRPMRLDPMDQSGLMDMLDKDVSIRELGDNEDYREKSKLCDELEKMQEDEDTFYLKEVIEIRKGLWT